MLSYITFQMQSFLIATHFLLWFNKHAATVFYNPHLFLKCFTQSCHRASLIVSGGSWGRITHTKKLNNMIQTSLMCILFAQIFYFQRKPFPLKTVLQTTDQVDCKCCYYPSLCSSFSSFLFIECIYFCFVSVANLLHVSCFKHRLDCIDLLSTLNTTLGSFSLHHF